MNVFALKFDDHSKVFVFSETILIYIHDLPSFNSAGTIMCMLEEFFLYAYVEGEGQYRIRVRPYVDSTFFPSVGVKFNEMIVIIVPLYT